MAGGISLLDFERADPKHLFDNPFQNWLGVFTYHRPSIALILSPDIRPNLRSFSSGECDELGLTGRYIAEAESCHQGDIEICHIEEAWLIAARCRVSFRSADLRDFLHVAERRERALMRRKPRMWDMEILDLEIEATPSSEPGSG